MRQRQKAVAGLLAALAVLAMLAAPAAAEPDRISVSLDHATIMKVPEGSRLVIVGNPAIADVALQKNGVVVITGKAFGLTNLIAMDNAGKLLAESLISVGPQTQGVVIFQRGLQQETYSCQPLCAPALSPGDEAGFFGRAGSQSQTRNQLATSPNQK